MTAAYCGVDFGTTNSSAAVARANDLTVLPLDPANDSPRSLPSLLYITSDADRIVGRGAADAFIARNVGREVLTEQVDLGIAIEGYVGGEQDKENGYRPPDDPNVREALRAMATVEVNAPGRLFQSVKSYLRLRQFTGTEVFGHFYQIEELTAMILRHIKRAVDYHAGESVDSAVFGRPVRFSKNPEEDALAEHRLRVAAGLAGFKNVTFFYEPVAACVEYAVATERTQRLMVVDIGGGTCDVCVMEFGGAGSEAERLASSKILGVAGVPVAGDAVDRDVIRHKLFPCFGSRARYGPSQLPMPQYLYRHIADWQNLYKLNTEETVNWLIAAESSSDQPKTLRALRYLIQRNYGYPVTRVVELAKKALSSTEAVSLLVQQGDIDIDEPLARPEFEEIIEDSLEEMYWSIEEAERLAGVTPDQVDLVLTTGGTSLIPVVRRHLVERFGEEKLRHRDTFTSVASGLAIVAKHLNG